VKVRGGVNHGDLIAERQVVSTSKYAGVTCSKLKGLIWYCAHLLDPSTGVHRRGTDRSTIHATEELAAMAVSMDRLPPGSTAPQTGHHLLRSVTNNECRTSVPFE